MVDWYEAKHNPAEDRDDRTGVVFLSARDGIGYEPDPEKQRAKLPFGVWESDVHLIQSMLAEPALPLPVDDAERGNVWVPGRLWPISRPYTGLGPRGYQRSDERIWEDICERLTRHGWVDASQVKIDVEQGAVTLHGSVDGRVQKTIAQATAEGVPGVTKVNNRLRLRKPTPLAEEPANQR